MILRRYQGRMLDETRANIAAGKMRNVMVSPTGSGKGTIATEIIRGAARHGSKIGFLVNRRELVKDMSRRLDHLGVEHGVIMANHPRRRPWLPVQIASVDTLRRKPVLPHFDILIADECHFALSDGWLDLFAKYPDAAVIGMTATPIRADGQGLGRFFDAMVLGPSVQELIDEGNLVPTRVFAPSAPDLRDVDHGDKDYNRKQLSVACRKPKLVGDIVHHWLKLGRGRPTILFAVDQGHAKEIQAEFLKAGVRAEYADCDTASDVRDTLWEDLAAYRVEVVCSVGIVSYGWDCLDSQTEILTGTGWKGIGEVRKGDPVYSMNLQTGFMELVPTLDVGQRPRRPDERMVHFGGQRLNVRVTEGHRIFGMKRGRGGLDGRWRDLSAMEVAEARSQTTIPLAAPMECFPGVNLTDDELRFVAWFLTDGSRSAGSSRIEIAQSKAHWVEIQALLDRLGYTYQRKEKIRSGFGGAPKTLHRFFVPLGVKQGKKGFSKLAPYLDKNVSPALHSMTVEQFEIFWSELLKGDGDVQKGKSGWLWCDRKDQADAYTWMAAVRGIPTSYKSRTTKRGKTVYAVTARIGAKSTLDLNPYASHCKAKRQIDPVETVYVPETVWCVTNRNGTLVTRRNGKVIILGNCPPCSCAILARPTESLALFLQQCGRILRPSPGKTDALILDHAGNTLKHGFPEDDRVWSLKDGVIEKEKEKGVAGVRICRKCFIAFSVTQTACPNGHPYVPKKRELEHINGELQELSPIRYWKCTWCRMEGRLAPDQDYSINCPLCHAGPLIPLATKYDHGENESERRKKYLAWVAEGKAKGYKPNWATVRYHQTFNRWPKKEWKDSADAQMGFQTLVEEAV